jgi:hypothetical protein
MILNNYNHDFLENILKNYHKYIKKVIKLYNQNYENSLNFDITNY